MTPTIALADVSRQLAGYTLLRRMEFSLSSRDGEYDLALVLARESELGAPAIDARFETVSRLTVQDFGGGLTQLLYLMLEDVARLDPLVTRTGYDPAGRKTADTATDGAVETYHYDMAGHMTAAANWSSWPMRFRWSCRFVTPFRQRRSHTAMLES